MLTDQIETFQLAQTDGTTSVLIPVTDVSFIYQNTIERIGLLTQDEIILVTNAYLLMRELPDRIKLIRQSTASAEEALNAVHVGSEYFETLQKLHANFLSKINEAIAALGQNS